MENQTKLSDNAALLNKVFGKHVSGSIISMFGVMAQVMANSIIAGRFFGAQGLAVMSVVAPFYSLFATIGALSGVGGAMVASHAVARDDDNAANRAFTASIFLSAGIYIFVAALCLFFLDRLIVLLGCAIPVFDLTKKYAIIYILGGYGTALMYIPYNFFKLVGKLQLLKIMYLAMAAMNIILDLIFIELLGDIDAIALGTVISTLVMSTLGVKFLLPDFKITLPQKKSLKLLLGFRLPGELKKLLRLGLPSALNNLLTFFRLILLNNIIVAAAGSGGLAAFSVFSSLEKFSLVFLSGLAQATASFVGVFSKEMDTVSVRRIEIRAHLIGAIFIVPMIAGLLIFPTEICNFFGIYDNYRLGLARAATEIFALSLPFSICCYLMFSYYQASGLTNLANILIFSRSFLFLVGPAYILTPIYGINFVWYSMTIASIAPLVLMLFAIPYYSRRGLSGVFLQDLSAEKTGKYISFAVKANVDSIIDSVEKIADFCKQNQLTKKEIMLVRLSMEEMMISISEHSELKPDDVMDVRILLVQKMDNLMIVLRIRNGGKLFNPIQYYENMQDKEDMDALGIEMIVNAADAIHYKKTFGINNLTVIIDRQSAA